MLNNTYQGFCIAAVCGSPGSGKSYILARDVLKRLEESDARVITNLPLNVSEIAAEVSRKTGQSAESVAARVHLIDADTLQRWRTPSKVIGDNDKPVMVVHGPWEFSDDFAAKSDFILDECHIYCPRKGVGSVLFQKPWQDFLGEARHRGYRRLVFVTQDEAKVGTSILEHAELRYELTNAERLRDPWFRISLGDWFELVASITRKYQSSVALTEYRRLVGKMKIVHSERIALDPFFFKFYRSHEVAGGGSETGQVDRPLREFEKRGRFFSKRIDGVKVKPTWKWFLRRNWFQVGSRLALVVAVFAFCFGGGVPKAVGWFTSGFSNFAVKAAGSDKAPAKDGSTVQALGPAGSAAKPGESSAAKPPAEWSAKLPAAMASLSPEQRAPIEAALKEAAAVANERSRQIAALESSLPENQPTPAAQLPAVTAFFPSGAAMVQGRKVKAGDVLFFNGGQRRVKIRKIDAVERVVYLEDASILRFKLGQPASFGLPEFAGAEVPRSAADSKAQLSTPVRSLDGSPEGAAATGRGDGKGERSIVVGRSDAPTGVRAAPGR